MLMKGSPVGTNWKSAGKNTVCEHLESTADAETSSFGKTAVGSLLAPASGAVLSRRSPFKPRC
jgi:hypothetical protein